MAETALKFGPEWLRALSHGAYSATPSTQGMPIPKYKLAEHRYGREEMLALCPKDLTMPNGIQEFSQLLHDRCRLPLALVPITKEEQHIWARSMNSDAVLRASGKTGPGNNTLRTARGGSVDRGRGRGRGYFQRGLSHEDVEEGYYTSFSRPKPIERSQSASEKDQRWDDRDRRYDRTFSGRGSCNDENSMPQTEGSRGNHEHWRKFDKDEDCDWRSSGLRSADKMGNRMSWRNDIERGAIRNGNLNETVRNTHHPSHTKTQNNNVWSDDMQGNSIPEWSVDEVNETDIVGSFDSSGAFMETKELIKINEDNKDEKRSKKMESPPKPVYSNQNGVTQNMSMLVDGVLTKDRPAPSVPDSCKNNQKSKKTEKVNNHVIKPNTFVELHSVNNNTHHEFIPVSLPNVPHDMEESANSGGIIFNSQQPEDSILTVNEDDAFAHHKKATENMVALWTEEEEKQTMPPDTLTQTPNNFKWFYQDPQGELQGPFTSAEMLHWYNSGYFNLSLMLRRDCDEKYTRLGELVDVWGRLPFIPGTFCPVPLLNAPLATTISTPMTPTIVPNSVASVPPPQLPKREDQLLAFQHQIMQQQILQQQLLISHAQMQQIAGQVKQENFSSLSQQQQQVMMQQLVAQQHLSRAAISPVGDQASMATLPLPLMGLPIQPLVKNDMMWNLTHGSGSWPIGMNVAQPPGDNIWDLDTEKKFPTDSEMEKRMTEETEKSRLAAAQRLECEQEMEEKRQKEECLRQEIQQKEKQEKEEARKRLQEEEKQLAELKFIEEQKRMEDLKREEELRIKEEQQRIAELKRQEEIRLQEEDRKRLEELKKEELKQLEELHKQEEIRKKEELAKLEEKRKKELQRKIKAEKEKNQEQERQKEALQLKEMWKEEKLQKERQKQKAKEEMENKKTAEMKLKAQGPAWGIQTDSTKSEISLFDIQRLQEEKEKQEKEEKIRLQLLQQQAMKQVQPNKNGLSWAKRTGDSSIAVKSLSEIQLEEAESLAQKQRLQKSQIAAPPVISNAGVWGNASQLNRTSNSQNWTANHVPVVSGFWDDTQNSATLQKPSKTNDSAFPALANSVQPANVCSNKSKNVRAKKQEDVVTRLFGTHHKPTDEFTLWCTEALSSFPSSVDVPTFVAFLKDVESPYEVQDYVKSYVGEGKEAREFARQFLERRSKFKNQSKPSPIEENMWGPAPAITPSVYRTPASSVNGCDVNSATKGKIKKRKGRMQKLDNSMLGFTVQPNPDRINVGEIDHVEGM